MNDFSKYMYDGLKKVNQITKNINFQKTTEEYLNQQIKTLNTKFHNIDLKKNNLEENFFSFLNKNKNNIQKIKVFIIIKNNPVTFKELLHNYFCQINKEINQDKMFYFYFNLVLIDQLLKDNNKNFNRRDLTRDLKDFLKNHCTSEKYQLAKCLSDNQIDIIPLSDFSNTITQKCSFQKNQFEKCVKNNFNKTKFSQS